MTPPLESPGTTTIMTAAPEPTLLDLARTGAHALRAVDRGAPVAQLTLITPTGLGSAQTRSRTKMAWAGYLLGRHTPVGDLLVDALSTGPSVRWFQRHKTYRDPDELTPTLTQPRFGVDLLR